MRYDFGDRLGGANGADVHEIVHTAVEQRDVVVEAKGAARRQP